MSEPLRLKICDACATGIPEDAIRCPKCGAPQGAPGEAPPSGAPQGAPGADPFAAIFGTPAERRAATGNVLRTALGQRLGCLVTAALLVFGVPLLFGAAFGEPLGGLAIPLLAISSVGLVLVATLVWLVWPRRPRGGS